MGENSDFEAEVYGLARAGSTNVQAPLKVSVFCVCVVCFSTYIHSQDCKLHICSEFHNVLYKQEISVHALI